MGSVLVVSHPITCIVVQGIINKNNIYIHGYLFVKKYIKVLTLELAWTPVVLYAPFCYY